MEIKVAVIGAGHLGAIHIQQWLDILDREQVYFYEPNLSRRDYIANQYSIRHLDENQLLSVVSIWDIVTPTDFHFYWAQKGIEHNKHLFIEKPVCANESEANTLIKLAQNSQSKIQIGHVERFNPAFIAIKDQIYDPRFFEIHRLAPFNIRGTEVSVVLDLMIHDLDILLYWVKSPIRNIYANGVNIVSNTPDIANVRLEFENGCVANITTSRISMKKMRKMRVFHSEGYTSIDFLEKESETYIIKDKKDNESQEGLDFENYEGKQKTLMYKKNVEKNNNAIKDELSSFLDSIKSNKIPQITLNQGVEVLNLALKINQMIKV